MAISKNIHPEIKATTRKAEITRGLAISKEKLKNKPNQINVEKFKTLENEIVKKDNHINELTERIHELTERIHELTERIHELEESQKE